MTFGESNTKNWKLCSQISVHHFLAGSTESNTKNWKLYTFNVHYVYSPVNPIQRIESGYSIISQCLESSHWIQYKELKATSISINNYEEGFQESNTKNWKSPGVSLAKHLKWRSWESNTKNWKRVLDGREPNDGSSRRIQYKELKEISNRKRKRENRKCRESNTKNWKPPQLIYSK